MNERKAILGVIIFTFGLFLLVSCKSSSQEEDNYRKILKGKWDLALWNNQQHEGVFVFKDSLLFFNTNFSTEISVIKINKDTLRANRIGGNMTFLSGYDYWIIDKADSDYFKIISSDGNITSGYKKKIYDELLKETEPEKRSDTASISL